MYDKVAPPSVRNELTFLCQAVPRSQTNAPKNHLGRPWTDFPAVFSIIGKEIRQLSFFR